MPMEIDESIVTEESDDQSSPKSSDSSGSNRVKFLYSYGGKILPRAADGKLRYMGGETRVFAADRSITFAELVSKMAEVLGSSVVLKFQLPTEDLDALVSIKSDEDLENLLEEYERLEVKVRAFLFPLNPNPNPPVRAMDHNAPPHISQEALGSTRFGVMTKSHISQVRDLQFKSQIAGSPRGLHSTQHETVPMAGRPPRQQYSSPVRYAQRSPAQVYDMAAMPPQHISAPTAAPTAYVDDSQLLRVDHLVYRGVNYHYISPPPHSHSAQVPFRGKATMAPPFHNPYQGGGLESFRAHHQLLVQH